MCASLCIKRTSKNKIKTKKNCNTNNRLKYFSKQFLQEKLLFTYNKIFDFHVSVNLSLHTTRKVKIKLKQILICNNNDPKILHKKLFKENKIFT